MPKKYSKKFLIAELQRLAKELGPNLRYDKLKAMKVKPSPSVYAKEFGSWNKAKKAADLEIITAWGGGGHPKDMDFNPLDHPLEFGYLYGVLFGDGSLSKRAIHLHVKDLDFLEYFKKNMKTLTGYTCTKTSKVAGKWMTYPSGHTGYTKPIVQTSFCHTKFVDWLRNDLKNERWKSYAKQYPEFARGFLKGFFDSEGQVCYHKRKYRYKSKYEEKRTYKHYTPRDKFKYFLCLSGIDKDLIDTVQEMLSDVLGIEKFTRHVDRRSFRKHPLYVMRFGNYSEDFIKFYYEIGITIKRKRPPAEILKVIRASARRSHKLAEAYPIAVELTKAGLTPRKIQKQLKEKGYEVTVSTLEGWIYRGNIPASKLHKMEGKKIKRGKLQRSCGDCKTGISERPPQAIYCEDCAKEHMRKYQKEWAQRPETKAYMRKYHREWRKKRKKK